MIPPRIALFFGLSLFLTTQLLPSTLYHEVIPVLPQALDACGLHALFNAYCFVTDIDYLDATAFKDFHARFLKLHGRIPRDGMYISAVSDMRTQLIPPDTETTSVLIIFKNKYRDGHFLSSQDLLSKIAWFHGTPTPKKLSIIFLYKHHYNTYNFHKDHSRTISLKVADSSFAAWHVHEQALILKELVLQGHYLANVTYKQLMAQKKRPHRHKKRRGWVKIAHFNSISGSGLSQKKPFRATFNLY
jgi:hypothetical protein